MRRTATLVGSLILLAGAWAAVSACDLMPDPEFTALENTLVLRVINAKRNASGDSVDFSFEFTNRGSADAKACLGLSRNVSYRTESSSGTSFRWVDHPGCMREFTIQSGGVMSWDETLEVSRLPQGHVEVEVAVQIVNPRRCGGWRCAALDLKSNQFVIP
jgi:hypothetical protein